MTGVAFRSLAFALLIGASAAACTSSGGTEVPNAGPTSSDLAWARTCVLETYGPVTHQFDGLTIAAARARAGRANEVMDFLAADGGCDVGRIAITAGRTYVHAAIANGRVVLARISKPHSRPRSSDRPLDIRIRLDQQTVRTGTSITGSAIVTNMTARPFLITDCQGAWLQVGLTSAAIPYEPGWLDCLDIPGTKLPVGTISIPITVATTYDECMPDASSATADTPACIHNAHGATVMPPLPPGTYTTTTAMLAPKGVPMPTPNTIPVTLSP
jgi:hypothetical protein